MPGKRRATEDALRQRNESLELEVEERAREVHASEQRFRKLVEASAHIVWTADAKGRFVEDSPSWRAFTGESPAEWLTNGWPSAIEPYQRDERRREWLDGIRRGEPIDMYFRLRHHTDGWRWMQVRAVPLRDDSGRITGWIGMNTDVTPMIESERMLRETRARLTVAELHERRRIAEILHNDLQQRLYGLQLKLDTLRQGGTRLSDAAHVAAVAEEAVGWIRQTIDLVRRLSVDLNPPILQGENLEDLLVWLQAQMHELHALRVDLQIREALPVPDPEIRILLFHSLRELLFNVVKHAGVKRVSLDARRDKGDVLVVVRDRGAGMSGLPEVGTGYGIFSIRDRLLLLGGDMKIESKPGKGTTVTLCVPLNPPERNPTFVL